MAPDVGEPDVLLFCLACVVDFWSLRELYVACRRSGTRVSE